MLTQREFLKRVTASLAWSSVMSHIGEGRANGDVFLQVREGKLYLSEAIENYAWLELIRKG